LEEKRIGEEAHRGCKRYLSDPAKSVGWYDEMAAKVNEDSKWTRTLFGGKLCCPALQKCSAVLLQNFDGV
jgi:hypothetical protein